MKRLFEEEPATPPVILSRHEGSRQSLVTSPGDKPSSPALPEDRIWLLSALDAQTEERDEEPA
jgi:hypothetical protein